MCQVPAMVVADGATITMLANDAGKGARLVDECNYDNNTSSVVIDACVVPRQLLSSRGGPARARRRFHRILDTAWSGSVPFAFPGGRS